MRVRVDSPPPSQPVAPALLPKPVNRFASYVAPEPVRTPTVPLKPSREPPPQGFLFASPGGGRPQMRSSGVVTLIPHSYVPSTSSVVQPQRYSQKTYQSLGGRSAHQRPMDLYVASRSPSTSLLSPASDASPRDAISLSGFKNIGNTCYMNAILASLVHITRFRDAVVSRRLEAEVSSARTSAAREAVDKGGAGDGDGA